MTPQPNNPGYRPEYKELEEARGDADTLRQDSLATVAMRSETDAIKWLAAEVRVMRLERALER